MWLGFLAILVAFGYALIKFLASLHMRRLRDVHARLLHEVKRERQRLQAVEGKLQVQRSQRGAVQQKLANARRFKDDLFGRLRLALPSTLTGELRECVNRHPIPEPEGVRTAHSLRLADKVTAALTSLSILVVEFSAGDAADGSETVLAGELVQQLTSLGALFTGPEPRQGAPEGSPAVLTTAFDEPAGALDLMTALGASHGEQVHAARVVLVAGITVTEFDQEHVNRLFARTLHSTRQLLEDADPGTLVLNERAHELLGDRAGISPRDGAEGQWVVSLAEPSAKDDEAAAPATADPPDPDRGVAAADTKDEAP